MTKTEMNKIRIILFSRLKYLIVRDADDKIIKHFKSRKEAYKKCDLLEMTKPNIHNKNPWHDDYYVIKVTDIEYNSILYYKFNRYIREKLNTYNAIKAYRAYSDNELFEITCYIMDYFLTKYFEKEGV